MKLLLVLYTISCNVIKIYFSDTEEWFCLIENIFISAIEAM